jgi:4a-hydroxytetrahydrobiopterin dehydratase
MCHWRHRLQTAKRLQPFDGKSGSRRNNNLFMQALKAKRIDLNLKAVPDWSQRANTIFRTFKFEGFMEAIDFVRRIAKQALKINHHPDIDIRYDKVTLTLSTHDEGGITDKDFSLAQKCDEIFSRFIAP